VRQLPKKKLPPDPVKVHVQGISEKTTEDCLRFYLEKFCNVEVVEVYLGCNNDALATFESEPGNFESITSIFTMRKLRRTYWSRATVDEEWTIKMASTVSKDNVRQLFEN